MYYSGNIGGIDSSLAALEMRSEERRGRREELKAAALKSLSTWKKNVSESDEITEEETSDDETLTDDLTTIKKQRIIYWLINANLDRTNISVRKESMRAASVLNEAGVPASTVTPGVGKLSSQRAKLDNLHKTAGQTGRHL